MKILYIGNEVSSHTSIGGYCHIKNFPNSDFLDVSKVCPFFWKIGKPFKFLNYILADYIACSRSKNYDIVHSIYEDNYYFPLFFKCKCKMVGTVHLDIDGAYSPIRKFILKRMLKKLDLIITLSTEQKKKLLSLGYNAEFLPHGFSPPVFMKKPLVDLNENKINIFFSGNTYRDLDLLEKIISGLESNPNIQFHILSQKGANKKRFMQYKNAKIYERVHDDVYFSLLSVCDYCFLPLIFATANNTLLEAHFLGITSIVPYMQGIKDYAVTQDMFYSSDYELIEIFSNLRKRGRDDKIRQESEKFLWKNIFLELEKKYSALLNI